MHRRLMAAVAIAVLATSTLTAAASAQPPTLDPTATVGDGEEWTVFYWGTSPSALGVFLVRPDGSGYHQIPLEGRGELALGSGSPDGKWIVYSTYPALAFYSPPTGSNLYRMHPDGTGAEQLTFNTDATHRAMQPRYTPDGESIVFSADSPGTRTISVMPANGGDARVVVDRGTHGVWQPDVDRVAADASMVPTSE